MFFPFNIISFSSYVIDITTDGKWCYIVLWALPHSTTRIVKWENLKNRLLSVCPSCSVSFYFNLQSSQPKSTPVYLLKFFCLDRKGLLHGNNIYKSQSLYCSFCFCRCIDCIACCFGFFLQMLLKFCASSS